MANGKLLETILKTVLSTQKKNASNPNQQTANPNVFDLIKNKIQDAQGNHQRGGSTAKPAGNIFDLIKKAVKSAKRENKKDPNVETADPDIFDNILRKVEEKEIKKVSTGLKRVVEDYNLDVSRLPKEAMQQIQAEYTQAQKKLDEDFANGIYKLIKRAK